MRKNINNPERVVRVIIGIILLSLIFIGPKSLWGIIGLIPLTTGLGGYCPIYSLMGKKDV